MGARVRTGLNVRAVFLNWSVDSQVNRQGKSAATSQACENLGVIVRFAAELK
jgi:hypothetical protein